MISKQAVDAYLHKQLNNYLWMKRLKVEELVAEYEHYKVKPYFKTNPWLHQHVMFHLAMCNPHFLFFYDMGTGKTKSILDVITQVQREGKLKRALVTVNGKLTVDSWGNAIAQHSDLHPIIVNCEDSEEKFERLISLKGDITVIDYPSLHHALGKKVKQGKKHVMLRDDKRVEMVKKLYNFYNGDESQKIKNTDTLRYAILNKLTKDMDYRYLMTGTPMGRNPEDVFSQFYLTDRGETFGDTLGMFRAGFFLEKAHQWKGIDYVFDKHKERLFHKFIQHKSLRYEDWECNDIPQCNEIPVTIEFCSEQREHYLRAIEGLMNAGGKVSELDNNYHKMRQAVAGFLKWEDEYGAHIIKFKRNNKLDWIEEFLSDCGDSKLIISHEYRESGRLIEERLTKLGIGFESVRGGTKDPVAAVTRFKTDPDKKVFIMNSEAGGTGTDGLQEVARYLVFYESPTSAITRKQTIKRVHRAGQKHRTFVYNLMLKGSIDMKVLDDVNEGRDTHESLMNGKFSIKSFLLFNI
jgi:SNF2 family DNA or RNA helicase